MPLLVNCPECQEALDVEDRYRTWKVRCPKCQSEFCPDDVVRRTDRSEDSADRDDEYRPRRRRRRGRYDDPEDVDFDAARQQVAQPGLWLCIVGWGSAALCLLGGGLCLVFGIAAANAPNQNPNQNGQDTAILLIVYGTCFGVFGVPYFALMGYGGLRMLKLSSRGWAMAGAILGIASIVLFGICGAFHIGIGIWALTALLNQNVEAAFRFHGEEHNRSWRDDSEWGPDDS